MEHGDDILRFLFKICLVCSRAFARQISKYIGLNTLQIKFSSDFMTFVRPAWLPCVSGCLSLMTTLMLLSE